MVLAAARDRPELVLVLHANEAAHRLRDVAPLMPVYVEIRVFTWDSEKDAAYEVPAGMIDAKTLEFKNLTNASAVFEDARLAIEKAEENGTHLLTERVKPGAKKKP